MNNLNWRTKRYSTSRLNGLNALRISYYYYGLNAGDIIQISRENTRASKTDVIEMMPSSYDVITFILKVGWSLHYDKAFTSLHHVTCKHMRSDRFSQSHENSFYHLLYIIRRVTWLVTMTLYPNLQKHWTIPFELHTPPVEVYCKPSTGGVSLLSELAR